MLEPLISFFRNVFTKKRLKKKIIEGALLLLPTTLAALFFVIVFFDMYLVQTLQDLAIHPDPFAATRIAPYPTLTAVIPQVSAQSAVIMDAASHVLMYQKNANLRISPASTTKMMTALVSLDYFHPNDILSVKKLIDTQGSGLDLRLQERLTYEQLLRAALIYSANDAAAVIAQNYPGGEKAFVVAMNEKAQQLHLVNTHFGDADGLDDTQDYTTAKELVTLAEKAMENPFFRSIVATKSTTISSADGVDTYQIKNRNILLGKDGVIGIKTGYTDEAGEVLATADIVDGHTFYIIVMKSDDRFGDTQKLLRVLPTVTYVSPNIR